MNLKKSSQNVIFNIYAIYSLTKQNRLTIKLEQVKVFFQFYNKHISVFTKNLLLSDD